MEDVTFITALEFVAVMFIGSMLGRALAQLLIMLWENRKRR